MPTYFIDVTEDDRRSEGQDGLEIPGDEEAVEFAWVVLRDILLEYRAQTARPVVEIGLRDESGSLIYRLVTTGERVPRQL